MAIIVEKPSRVLLQFLSSLKNKKVIAVLEDGTQIETTILDIRYYETAKGAVIRLRLENAPRDLKIVKILVPLENTHASRIEGEESPVHEKHLPSHKHQRSSTRGSEALSQN